MAPNGIVGLIHPESHFTELRAKALRSAKRTEGYGVIGSSGTKNELFEMQHAKEYGVHVYGDVSATVCFRQAASLYHPILSPGHCTTMDLVLSPGVKDEDDRWDLRPHAERIIDVTESQLAVRGLFLLMSLAPQLARRRMLYPVNRASAKVLDKIACSPET